MKSLPMRLDSPYWEREIVRMTKAEYDSDVRLTRFLALVLAFSLGVNFYCIVPAAWQWVMGWFR